MCRPSRNPVEAHPRVGHSPLLETEQLRTKRLEYIVHGTRTHACKVQGKVVNSKSLNIELIIVQRTGWDNKSTKLLGLLASRHFLLIRKESSNTWK